MPVARWPVRASEVLLRTEPVTHSIHWGTVMIQRSGLCSTNSATDTEARGEAADPAPSAPPPQRVSGTHLRGSPERLLRSYTGGIDEERIFIREARLMRGSRQLCLITCMMATLFAMTGCVITLPESIKV